MKTHTPAPWVVCVHENETTIEAESQSICFGVSNCDASLISAAPELLECVEFLLSRSGDRISITEEFHIKDVIAKAKRFAA